VLIRIKNHCDCKIQSGDRPQIPKEVQTPSAAIANRPYNVAWTLNPASQLRALFVFGNLRWAIEFALGNWL